MNDEPSAVTASRPSRTGDRSRTSDHPRRPFARPAREDRSMAAPVTAADEGRNLIGGVWSIAGDGRSFEQRNPADLGEVTGHWPSSTADDAREAIDAAASAFAGWSAMTPYGRADILRRALRRMEERA